MVIKEMRNCFIFMVLSWKIIQMTILWFIIPLKHFRMFLLLIPKLIFLKCRCLQKAELRCLLPKSLLDRGFFSGKLIKDVDRTHSLNQHCGYSWSGQRKVPPYLNKLVFPEEFLTALRTISLQEHELTQVSSLLGELVGSEQQEIPCGRDVQAAVWEAVGDFGALELLIDLLRTRLMELEEGSGTEAQDTELLDKLHLVDSEESERMSTLKDQEKQMNMNRWSSIVYRRGQKQLTSLFLKEAEHALELLSNDLP